jgi:hypothetical protein
VHTFTPNYTGDRRAYAYADSDNDVVEGDETNNVGSRDYWVSPVAPDLIALVDVQPDPLVLGHTVTITATARNVGTAPSGPFVLGDFRHRTTEPVVGTTPDVSWPVAGLGQSESETHSDELIPGFPGDRTAWAFADVYNAVAEIDETNNTASEDYSIVAMPDLVATATVAPDPVTLGEDATLTAEAENIGTGATGAFTLAAWSHLTAPPAPSSTPEATWTIGSLAAGGTATRVHSFTTDTPGFRTAWVLADSTEAVDESDETNNADGDFYMVAGVPPAPTGVLAVSAASAAPTRGGQVAVTYSLSAPAAVQVQVRNVAGRPVARLAQEQQAGGANTAVWSGRAAGGARVPAGVYLCEIVAQSADGQTARAIASVRLGR